MAHEESIWNWFLSEVEDQLSAHVMNTWLRPIKFIDEETDSLRLGVRDQFARDWLKDHYQGFIAKTVATRLGQPPKIHWEIRPDLYDTKESNEPEEPEEPPQEPREHSLTSQKINQNLRLPSQKLNSKYHFKEFVCGPSNEFALAAAKAVAMNPGQSYNPLFLFGGVGLGKTHLLTAIGHSVLADNPSTKIVYITAEQFTNEVVNAVLGSKLEEFRNKYRAEADLLLIDDIQLLAGKERTQHELFHVFNTLYDSQRQIVLTSDKLPHELPKIEERLRNRFQWGLIADIHPPEIETRVAIIRQKASKEGIDLPDGVAFYLAKNIKTNVRELEGALLRVMAHSSLTRAKITEAHAQRVLADILPGQSSQLTIESIQKIVANYFQVKVSDLKSRGRQQAIVRPRQIAMYLCRKHAGSSFPDLGRRFGKKDHTTVMSACKRVDSMLKDDPSIRSQISDLERQLDVIAS